MLKKLRSASFIGRRRGSAALEFVIVAPVLSTLAMGVYEIAKALIVWQELTDAAEQVVQAANKLSISTSSSVTQLTASQMQHAMSTIYAAIPGLALGSGTGTDTGTYGVTLSSVVFLPLCSLTTGCTPDSPPAQTPYVLWSTALTEGGPQLGAPQYRPCGALASVSVFPNDSTQLSKMISPSGILLTPQVVADVRYTYTPKFLGFVVSKTFYASAAMPSSSGGTDQQITLDTSASTAGVQTCTLP